MKNKFFLLLLLAPLLYGETKLIVLGSGTPNPDPNRAGSAYAVVVNETPYLIDFGTRYHQKSCIPVSALGWRKLKP
jgi:hypothetical protein